jgi:hydroxymethylbilane synthase
MQKLRLATRQSKLALWQANFIKDKLEALHTNLRIELIGLTTKGDEITDKPLASFGGKGLFTKELEKSLLQNEADIAVHSLKDVPPQRPEKLVLAAFSPRADVRDVLISNQYSSLADLPTGATVGTCSVRRTAQVLALRPDIQIKMIRGNVDTRIAKLDNGEYDALIMAAAGLERLDLQHRISEYFTPEVMLPSVGQGALTIECRRDDQCTLELVSTLNDPDTAACVTAERTLILGLQGNCHSPIGAYARIVDGELYLRGLVANANGSIIIKDEVYGEPKKPELLGHTLANKLISLGSDKLLQPFSVII